MTVTLQDAAEVLDAWLTPARDAWNHGQVVHLTIAPGDATAYRMTFVPASPVTQSTTSSIEGRLIAESPPVFDDDRLLVVHGASKRVAVVVAPASQPWPSYVAEKLATDNRYSLLTIGLTWWLMAGNSPEDAAVAYSELTGPGGPNPLTEWDLARFDRALTDDL